MQQGIIKATAYIVAVMILAFPFAYAANDTYIAVNSNKLEYGSRGTVTAYKPSIINTVSSDHRDYMVYTVQPSSGHTIGAGMEWYKINTGSIIGWLMVYVNSALACKATSSTSTSCNPTSSSYCWIGSVVDASTGYSISKGRCFGTYQGINFATGIPGATSRSFSTYNANPANTLKNLFDNLGFLWHDGSNQRWAYFDVSNSTVWISETKCMSNNSSNQTGWVIDFLNTARKFGTGPPTYTTDECVIDVDVWRPGGEP